MNRILVFIAVIICAVAPSLSPSENVSKNGIAFYVSTEGNDAWSGKLAAPNAGRSDGPFRTVAAARDALRSLRTKGPLNEAVSIYIRGGNYFLNEPLVFSPEDSGTPTSPVVYAAYRGETPVLSGGRQIRDWVPAAGTHPAGAWQAELPEAKEGKLHFHQLFIDGQRRQRPRAPKTGYFLVDGDISRGDPARFKFHDNDIRPSWVQADDVGIVILAAWSEFRMFIKAVDPTTNVATISTSRMPPWTEKNARYWIENAVDTFNTPGEWYLDGAEGRVLYIPRPGEDLKRSEVIASNLPQLIRFEGDIDSNQLVHDITLRGLTFSYTEWSIPPGGYYDMQAAYDVPASIDMSATSNSSIEQCSFTHLGQWAVELHHGAKGIHIIGNEMTDLGAGGVKIGDPKDPNEDAEATEKNVISDNHIHDIGVVYPAAVGVWIGQSSDNTVAHNEIDHTFYTGISVGWTWGYGPTAAHHNILEFNHIHDIGRGLLSDMGCIYSLGVEPGTVERNNVCHDVRRYEHGYGGWGLYTDEGSSNILLENNLVYRTQDGSFHQHYGANNMIRNNIFSYGETAEVRRSQQEDHLSFTFEHNIVYWKAGPLLLGEWTDGHYRFDSNLYFRTDGKLFNFLTWSFEEWQKRGQDTNSLIADPLFVDPEHGDFQIRPESPAAKVGFKPFDITEVGPRKSSRQ